MGVLEYGNSEASVVNELINAAGEGYHCTIAFVIQMKGIRGDN